MLVLRVCVTIQTVSMFHYSLTLIWAWSQKDQEFKSSSASDWTTQDPVVNARNKKNSSMCLNKRWFIPGPSLSSPRGILVHPFHPKKVKKMIVFLLLWILLLLHLTWIQISLMQHFFSITVLKLGISYEPISLYLYGIHEN